MPTSPSIVAHRGASHDAVENTLVAFALAWKQGADAIEGDFHLTSDGCVVCHHDAALGRIFPGRHALRDLPLAELQALSAGQIPTLAQFLETVPKDKRALLELKTGPEIIEPVAREVARSGLDASQLTFMAFDSETVRTARKRFSQAIVNWLVDLEAVGDPEKILPLAQELHADGLGLSASSAINAAFLAPFITAGMQIHVWTVDDPAEARRYADLGLASITTNRPGFLRRVLAGSAEVGNNPDIITRED